MSPTTENIERIATELLGAFDSGGTIASVAEQPQSEPLEAGEVITTGTLTAAMPIAAGETWSSAYEGVPWSGLTVRFTS